MSERKTKIKNVAQEYASMATSFNTEESFEAGAEWAINEMLKLLQDEIETTKPYTRKYALEHGTREADFELQAFERIERKIEGLK